MSSGCPQLFNPSQQKIEAAKARLERKRGKDRKHYENNTEKMRERDRERYGRKKAASNS
jgi:hypothetical protein